MPSLLARLLVAICCLFVLTSQADDQTFDTIGVDNTIVLDDRAPALQINSQVDSWLDEGSHASI